MKILNVKILDGARLFEYSFDRHNLIVSNEMNTCGKTTFLRLLLYAMGFNVTSTRGYSFANKQIIITMEINNEVFTIHRLSKSKLIVEISDARKSFSLPNDLNRYLSTIFGIEDYNVLSNLLGVFYIDQDNGWNWFVRGMVVGRSNHFDAIDLLAGLSKSDIHHTNEEINKIKEHLRVLNQIKKTSSYFDYSIERFDDLSENNSIEEIRRDITMYKFELNKLLKERNRLTRTVKSNKSFIDSIEDMNLVIELNNGDEVEVTKENLIGFSDNQKLLKYTLNSINLDINILKDNIKELSLQMSKIDSPIQTEKLGQMVSSFFVKNNLSVERIEIMERNYREDLKLLQNYKNEIVVSNREFSKSLYSKVKYFSEKLDVFKYIGRDYKNIFRQNMNVYSGAIKSKIALAYRLSYLQLLQEKYNISIPLIIDSPRNNEISEENVNIMLNVLKDDFQDSQVILASIYHNEVFNYKTFLFNKKSKFYTEQFYSKNTSMKF